MRNGIINDTLILFQYSKYCLFLEHLQHILAKMYLPIHHHHHHHHGISAVLYWSLQIFHSHSFLHHHIVVMKFQTLIQCLKTLFALIFTLYEYLYISASFSYLLLKRNGFLVATLQWGKPFLMNCKSKWIWWLRGMVISGLLLLVTQWTGWVFANYISLFRPSTFWRAFASLDSWNSHNTTFNPTSWNSNPSVHFPYVNGCSLKHFLCHQTMKIFYRLDFLQLVQFSSVAKSTCISAEDHTPRYDSTPSNGEAPVLELWGI